MTTKRATRAVWPVTFHYSVENFWGTVSRHLTAKAAIQRAERGKQSATADEIWRVYRVTTRRIWP